MAPIEELKWFNTSGVDVDDRKSLTPLWMIRRLTLTPAQMPQTHVCWSKLKVVPQSSPNGISQPTTSTIASDLTRGFFLVYTYLEYFKEHSEVCHCNE